MKKKFTITYKNMNYPTPPFILSHTIPIIFPTLPIPNGNWYILLCWELSILEFIIPLFLNCFCGMVDQRKVFSLISSRDHCQRSSPSRISGTPRTGFEPAQNLSSGLVEWSCVVVIITTPRRHLWPCYK